MYILYFIWGECSFSKVEENVSAIKSCSKRYRPSGWNSRKKLNWNLVLMDDTHIFVLDLFPHILTSSGASNRFRWSACSKTYDDEKINYLYWWRNKTREELNRITPAKLANMERNFYYRLEHRFSVDSNLSEHLL